MRYLLSVVSVLCSLVLFSQADDCSDGLVISEGSNMSFSTIGATTDGPEHANASCFAFGGDGIYNDIWYSYTATSSTYMEWTTCNFVNFDTRLAVYQAGTSCPLEDQDLLACNDDGVNCLNFTSYLFFEVVSGETYLLRLGGYQEGEFGEGTFDLNAIPEPDISANSICSDADFRPVVTIEDADNGLGWTYGSNILAPMEESQETPFCAPIGEYYDVWYEFNNGANDSIEIRFDNLTDGALYNIEIFGSCDSLAATAGDGGELINNCFPTGSVEAGSLLVFGFENPAVYLLRISTQITNDTPGDFRFQLVGQQEAVSVQEVFENYSISLFPNPVESELMIKNPFESCELIIYNISGKQVYRGLMNSDITSIDVSSLSSGLYVLELIDEGKIAREKLIIR